MQDSAQSAHKTIMKEAPGSGTTITAMLIFDQQMTIAHAGDSRAYLITPGGRLQPLTRDHSLVMRMIELGQLTEEEAAVHPQRNVLYRALGQGDQFMADISTSPLPKAGHILICSDGLWGVVSEEKIVSTVNQISDPQKACQKLVDDANAAGGPDNISAVLIKLPDSD
jgi:serine/threonine protein phosphatase PrpC